MTFEEIGATDVHVIGILGLLCYLLPCKVTCHGAVSTGKEGYGFSPQRLQLVNSEIDGIDSGKPMALRIEL